MPELDTMAAPKTAGFVDSKYNRVSANKKRLMKDEAELDALMNGAEAKEEPVAEPEVAQVAEPEEVLNPEEKTYKKRYSDLRNHLNETTARIKELEERLSAAPTGGSIRTPKSDEDIEAWSQEYPDVAAIVEAIADRKAQEKFSKADDRLRHIDEITEKAERLKLENAIREKHTDFDALRDSEEFHNWADEQPKWVKDALYENDNDPKSVVRVIDLYKGDKGIDNKGRQSSTKAAASSVVSKRTGTNPDTQQLGSKIRESEVMKMSDKEFEANEDRILDAQRSGSFIYDIPGGAR